jgi:hypothetical protein
MEVIKSVVCFIYSLVCLIRTYAARLLVGAVLGGCPWDNQS